MEGKKGSFLWFFSHFFIFFFAFLLGFEIKAMNMKRGVLKSQQLEILPSLVFAFWGPFLCEVFSGSNLNKAEIGA